MGAAGWRERVGRHLHVQERLLFLEEAQMLDDYAKMDVFRAVIKSPSPEGVGPSAWTCPGCRSRTPPVAQGDTVLLRLDSLQQVELGLRVVNVEKRTQLVLQLSIGREELLDLARQIAGPDGEANEGVRDVERLVTSRAELARRPRGSSRVGPVLGHLRFQLNRSIMEYMHATLHWTHGLAERLHATHGRDSVARPFPTVRLPPIVVAMASEPSDASAGVRMLPRSLADMVRAADGTAPLTVPGRVDHAAVSAFEPIQPQLNPEQLQAVRDILHHRHCSVPYLVLGPPGTGKTMVVIETVLQALVCVEEPRLLVCAPSNAAADVIAKRLHAHLPEVERRRRAAHETEDAAALKTRMLRLNSQQRLLSSVPSELLTYCCQDPESAMFTVPPLATLLDYHIVIATCGATRLLYEAGVEAVQHHDMPTFSEQQGAGAAPEVGPRHPGNFRDDRFLCHTHGRFTHVLVDEASQGFEAELLLPLSFAYPGASVAMVGDHMQLGPMVRSPFCRSHGLATSMLERLMRLPVYGRTDGGDHAAASASAPAATDDDALAEAEAPTPEEAEAPTPEEVRLGRAPRCMTKLVRNYRSHRALLDLPSRLSYGGALVECADRAVTSSMAHWDELVATDFPLLFYGCQSAHSLYKIDPASAHPSSSYRNVTETEKIIELISSLLGVSSHVAATEEGGGEEADGDEAEDIGDAEEAEEAEEADERDEDEGAPEVEVVETNGLGATGDVPSLEAAPASSASRRVVTTNDIGVVTPFRAQVLHLRQQLRKRGLGAVRVGTVDDYQGQEELIIIISTVVGSASPRGIRTMQHGLMSSPQRFNVAITRAKALLVIVGDPNALWEDASWRELLQYAVDNNSYRGCAHPLASQGVEDDSLGTLAELINQKARRTLLGAGNAGLMFPNLLGGGDAIWAGEGEDIDDQIGWKLY